MALTELGVAIDATARSRLVDLAFLVSDWSAHLNLTGHRGPHAVLSRLVVDALALVGALRGLARIDSVVDLGSGAGFPGLPIAIAWPDSHVILVDSRERRHHFQRTARRALGLKNLEARLGRAEQLVPTPSRLVIAQAMARPARVLAWAMPWAEAGGYLVIPGGAVPPDPGSNPRLQAAGIARYRVPLGGPDRSLWWGRVTGGSA